MNWNLKEQNERREAFYARTREHLHEVVDENGVGKIPQFNPPHREPVWILPALYTGPQAFVDLANKMVARYHDVDAQGKSAKAFNIFQTNHFAHLFHRFDKLLTPGAREVMTWQAEQACKTLGGSGQPDTKYHGCNDNMPTMATVGLIMAGEMLGNKKAVDQGRWNLNQFRRLLSRGAWASEYNSSTYSAPTLTSIVQIASYSRDPELRDLARQIEHRLWAEILLHYHPGTMAQAGPQSRAYAVDRAGHNHSVQLLLWLVFGPELTGRDVAESYFNPDGTEVVHFDGNYFQNIAEYCHFMDADFRIPEELAHLITSRQYPARLGGRVELMAIGDERSSDAQTCTYMEEDFSIGSTDRPWMGGSQCQSVHVTYKRTEQTRNWRDAATAFLLYDVGEKKMGEMDRAEDGKHQGESYVSNRGWFYTIQKDNVVATLVTPGPTDVTAPSRALKLRVVFPAHYGKIARSVIGSGPVREGAVGESADVVAVSVEAGQVYIHVQPLLPTNLLRSAAVRFVRENNYEILDLINYEGPACAFDRVELARMANGAVVTVQARKEFASLEEFHQKMSQVVITDYLSNVHRFLLFQREDVEFDITYSPNHFGVQTEAIDGRHRPKPIFASNQIEVESLPFVTGPVARNQHLFPWGDTMDSPPWPNRWLIGSRGLTDEPSYSCRLEAPKPVDGQK